MSFSEYSVQLTHLSLLFLRYQIQMSAPTQFRLPDPLAHWPWPRALNPHYAEVKPESDGWLRSFEALDAKSQRSFDRCNFGKYSYHFVKFFHRQ